MSAQPALNITAATGGLIAANLAVHLIRLVLAPGLDQEVLVTFGFAPSLFLSPDGALLPPENPFTWLTPLTYGFLHGDFLHLLVNLGFLLAFGTLVERRLGSARFLVFYLLTGVLAIAGTTLLYLVTGKPVLVIGASGAIAGLFGGTARFAFQPPRRLALAEAGLRPPRGMNRGLLLGIVFIAINLLFGLFGLTEFGGIRAIAWEAHVTGFLVGAALFPLFDRRPGAGRT